jgi:DNA repair exonuclease SbcCD ATPase subunit
VRPLYLYGENFTCFKVFELFLDGISAALVLGHQDSNELESNGIGKTSIFRAIEYVLYAQTKDPVLGKDIVLEKLIQDEASKLLVIFDFEIDDQIYRITRARTRKGSTDLTFLKRNATPGNPHTSTTDKKLWTDLTCRRTADTDALIIKLIRLKYKSFINTNHLMQLDMGGIATATPEKRRAILKDIFDLTPYAGLEKIAKDRADKILEDIKRYKVMLETIGDPAKDIDALEQERINLDGGIALLSDQMAISETVRQEAHEGQLAKTATLSALEKSASSVLAQRASLTNEVYKLTTSVAEYTKKRKATIAEAKAITSSIQEAKSAKEAFTGIDFSYLPKLKEVFEATSIHINTKTIELGVEKAAIEELNIPMPEEGACDRCRQVLTLEHRQTCIEGIEKEKDTKTTIIKGLTTYIETQKATQTKIASNIKQLEQQQKQLNDLATTIIAKEKEFVEKQKSFNEHDDLLKRFSVDLQTKQTELAKVNIEAESSSEAEIKTLTNELSSIRSFIAKQTVVIDKQVDALNTLQSKKAVAQHSIEEKTKDTKRKEELKSNITALETEYTTYPYVIEGFASIPDMIIENVLEGLQEETNKLLAQIRPELQLEFATEKTRSDGEQDDTLDINYFLNNKAKDYSQLSGAQKLCVMFAFKLGLSFLLAKMNGSQIKFLMLDEVDMPFSHAAVDAYADIIRFFQKDFTVFVITHNDRLKTKFSNAILVEQDGNGVSRAKVVSSW